jgi:uncharacterized protein (TIGR02145 family)
MSLVFLQVDSWHSVRPGKYVRDRANGSYVAVGDYYLLNTNRMVDIVSLDMAHVQFKYNQAPDDARCSPDTITANITLASLITAHDTAPPSKFMTLPIFPTCDITRIGLDTPVFTQIEGDDIAMIYATPKDFLHGVCHMVYYRNSFERVTCIINLGLMDVYYLVGWPLEDYDGNVYRTVAIGSQEWICSDLKVTHYSNGVAIPYITLGVDWMADISGCYCFYNNDPTNKDALGALYNWYAVNNANGLAYFKRAGVAEAGWRIPTVADWTTLSTTAGGNTISGGRLKEKGLAYWESPNLGATDLYGFSSVGAGNRYVDSDDGEGWASIKIWNDIWSADAVPAPDDDEAYSIYLGYLSAAFFPWNHEKFGGMSVRCVRDIVI